MKKRMLALLLAAVMLFSLVPAVWAEEEAAETDIKALVAEQVRAYADSLEQSDAVDSAAMALATHGITGGGKKLSVGEGSALTAVLLIEGCTNGIDYMQKLDLTLMPNTNGFCVWREPDFGLVWDVYQVSGEAHETRDIKLYSWEPYTGETNDCDKSLIWMAGGTKTYLNIERIAITATETTYQVTCKVTDRFDFETSSNSGFKGLISGIGALLFKEFTWEATVSFELRVPYSCNHRSGMYHWTYDPENHSLAADGTDSYTDNGVTRHSVESSDGAISYYYELDETVRLYHDQPWTMEYDIKNPGKFVFSPLEQSVSAVNPCLYQSGRDGLYVWDHEYVVVSENVMAEFGLSTEKQQKRHFYGTLLNSLAPLSPAETYTFRLENEVSADGSNRITLTVQNTTTGEILLEKVPMDDYYQIESWVGQIVFQNDYDNWISGENLFINYIGSKNLRFSADYFDLRIWENGIDGDPENYYRAGKTVPTTCTETGYTEHVCAACGHTLREYGEPARGHRYEAAVTAPTCTEPGYTVYTCDCGESYVADHTEALGHDLTDWAVEQAPTCLESGAEERWCRRCDHRESRTADPLGHDYESVVIEPGCTVGGHTLHTCRNCGDSYKSDFTNAKGHSHEAVVTPATCTEGGFTTYTCPCGNQYIRDYTSALGHEYEYGICIRCGDGKNPFADVSAEAYYFRPVLWAVSKGITNGVSATEFGPDETCTRGQVVTFLWRAANCPEPASTSHPFTDLKKGEYYEKAVLWAVEMGITNGYTADTFNPDGECTRAQVVTFLHRAMGKPGSTAESCRFTDVEAGEWYTDAVLWALENGITNGDSATTFGVENPCTRGQVVTFLYRTYN